MEHRFSEEQKTLEDMIQLVHSRKLPGLGRKEGRRERGKEGKKPELPRQDKKRR